MINEWWQLRHEKSIKALGIWKTTAISVMLSVLSNCAEAIAAVAVLGLSFRNCQEAVHSTATGVDGTTKGWSWMKSAGTRKSLLWVSAQIKVEWNAELAKSPGRSSG